MEGWKECMESCAVTRRFLGYHVSIRFLSPLKCFFQLSMMFIVFKPDTSRSFISFVPMNFL